LIVDFGFRHVEVREGPQGGNDNLFVNNVRVRHRSAIDWLDDCIEMVEGGSLPAIATRRPLPSTGT
jgi:hypothetical protein